MVYLQLKTLSTNNNLCEIMYVTLNLCSNKKMLTHYAPPHVKSIAGDRCLLNFMKIRKNRPNFTILVSFLRFSLVHFVPASRQHLLAHIFRTLPIERTYPDGASRRQHWPAPSWIFEARKS